MATKRKTKPKGNPKGNQTQVIGYYPPDLAAQLDLLAERTHIRKAELLRMALRDLLQKPEYTEALRKGAK